MSPAEFRAAVAKLCAGATVEIDECDIRAEAPANHTWDGDLHEYVAEYRHAIGDPLDKEWRDNAFADVLGRIKSGPLQPCVSQQCEWCNPDDGDALMPMNDRHVNARLFIGVYPAGIVYADRERQENCDYRSLAFLPYKTLVLEFEKGFTESLRADIEAHAATIIARRGEQFQISTSGQTVMLGDHK